MPRIFGRTTFEIQFIVSLARLNLTSPNDVTNARLLPLSYIPLPDAPPIIAHIVAEACLANAKRHSAFYILFGMWGADAIPQGIVSRHCPKALSQVTLPKALPGHRTKTSSQARMEKWNAGGLFR
jgi:hypothetical protein